MTQQPKPGGRGAKAGKNRGRQGPDRTGSQSRRATIRIYGLHAARAAIDNPRRRVRTVFATANAAERLRDLLTRGGLTANIVRPDELEARLGAGAVHQGVMVEAEPLPACDIADLDDLHLVVVLDQVTDPQNVGAILRSAAAFGADALMMTTRHAPPLEGALAKAASGGLEHVPVVLITNLARGLAELGERGVTRIGLDSAGDCTFEDQPSHDRLALVLGAENKGLRRLTREHCDVVCALAPPGAIQSLNVSNAAAIALHHAWLPSRTPTG